MNDINYIKGFLFDKFKDRFTETDIENLVNFYNEYKHKKLTDLSEYKIYDIGLGEYRISIQKIKNQMKTQTSKYKEAVKESNKLGYVPLKYQEFLNSYNYTMERLEDLAERIIEEMEAQKQTKLHYESFRHYLEEKIRNFRGYYEQSVQKRACRGDFKEEIQYLPEL